MKKIFKKPYVYWTIGIFLFYILLDIFVSGFYNTIPLIFNYASTVNWSKLSISLVLTLLIGFLVALNSVYIYILYKERKKCKEEKVLTGVGALGGLIVGVCPLCITGIFPLVLGFFGISFSFASLPFQGVEIQLFIVGLLLINLWILKRK